MSKSKERIVLGLDYGTTYTGVAFSDTKGTIHDISLITDWPGHYGHSAVNEKVPSQVAYGSFPENENTYEWGTWGNLIPPNADRLYWTKLLLDQKSRPELRMILQLLNLNLGDDDDDGPPAYPGKDPKDIVTDYLTGVKNHVFRSMRRNFGPALFDSCKLDVVITVPAVWSDKAKDLTFQAVASAGFVGDKEHIKMVTEPEAAATYTLKNLHAGAGGDDFKPGDYFILCDAGGGTVDLLSYKIRTVSPEFKIEEAAVGTGDKCGATFVDRNFKKWLTEKLGDEVMARIPEQKLREGSKFAREFEAAKMHFSGAPMEVVLTLPREAKVKDDPANGIEDGELKMTHEDLKAMFDPPVNRTLELIDEQAAAVYEKGVRVKYVFVVGGFGKSEYLYGKVQEYCKDRGFEPRRPLHSWSAVARGAVARGLEPDGGGLVEMRMCRLHYGVPVSQEFDPSRHLEKDMYIDELTGEKNAKGQMNWLFSKGDPLPVNKPKRVAIAVSRKFKLDEERICSAQLAYCKEDKAPTRYFDNEVVPLCTVKADLRAVPVSKYTRARSTRGGPEFYIAMFSIELIVDNSRLKFIIMFGGEEYGYAVPHWEA